MDVNFIPVSVLW